MARGTVLSLVALAAPLFVGCSDTPSTNTFDASARDASARDITTADLPAADVPATMEPTPVVPVGIDAFRQIARMPVVRIGTRTYLRSTYDRTGGNEGADASHFLREERSDFNVTLDVEGQGALDFVRTNHWHGSPWHYGVDGMDQVVTESSTADPDHPVAGSIFLPSAPLPSPLTWTWSTTQGADLNWVPIEFQRSLTLGYGRTHYGTGYYIFQSFPKDATNLTHPLHTWDGRTPPSQDVLDLLNAAHAGAASVRPFLHGDTDATGTAALPASGSVRLADLAGPAVIRRLSLSVDPARAVDLGRATIRITWDDRSRPSVEAPIALFFGAGTLFSRDPAALRGAGMVRGLFSSIAVVDGAMVLEFRAPMPFFHHAVVELVGNGVAIPDIHWLASTSAWTDSPTVTGYLHATYVDHTAPMPGRDLVFLDTVGAEGERDWCGLFFGTSFVFSDRAELTTLEGDPRFFFDDSQTPQAQGTGTEEWGGGGDYWGGVTMSLPLAGHPTGAPSPGAAMNAEDQIESVYRFLVADAFPFGRNARIQFEHGGEDDSAEHYRSVTYWYGRPGACLVPTDHLHVGDAADEAPSVCRHGHHRRRHAHVALRARRRHAAQRDRGGPDEHGHRAAHRGRDGVHRGHRSLEPRRAAAPYVGLRISRPARGDLRRRRRARRRLRERGHLVHGGVEPVRAEQPRGGARRRRTRGADVEPALARRRVPASGEAHGGAQRDSRAGRVVADAAPAHAGRRGPPVGVERVSIYGVFVSVVRVLRRSRATRSSPHG